MVSWHTVEGHQLHVGVYCQYFASLRSPLHSMRQGSKRVQSSLSGISGSRGGKIGVVFHENWENSCIPPPNEVRLTGLEWSTVPIPIRIPGMKCHLQHLPEALLSGKVFACIAAASGSKSGVFCVLFLNPFLYYSLYAVSSFLIYQMLRWSLFSLWCRELCSILRKRYVLCIIVACVWKVYFKQVWQNTGTYVCSLWERLLQGGQPTYARYCPWLLCMHLFIIGYWTYSSHLSSYYACLLCISWCSVVTGCLPTFNMTECYDVLHTSGARGGMPVPAYGRHENDTFSLTIDNFEFTWLVDLRLVWHDVPAPKCP